eukprot:7458661-Alexandrium_andersonii.AAC.1
MEEQPGRALQRHARIGALRCVQLSRSGAEARIRALQRAVQGCRPKGREGSMAGLLAVYGG